MYQKRTDLALEAHELWRGATKAKELRGVVTHRRETFGCGVTAVEVTEDAAARALGKPVGTYITLELDGETPEAMMDAARALGAELRALLGKGIGTALVVGLGNRAMTPDAVGPLAAEHILVTRHLKSEATFSTLTAVSVLAPGVLGRTGLEAAEQVRGAVEAVRPDVVIAVDALAARSLERLCRTVQLSDTGIVPGSGVGNHRAALDRAALGVPVYAVGVPTVVDAATLALDILEEAGAAPVEASALRGHDGGVMVTPRDIDAQVRALARIVGLGIDLALQPLEVEELTELLG